MESYHPETYWSEVAERIESREDGNIVAGDDSPYYRYKRKKFLNMFHKLEFKDKEVCEIGHGPGGNLIEVLSKGPKSLTGVDISDNMIKLARKNTQSSKVDFIKTDGKKIKKTDKAFDLVFSATVLQHNSDEKMMEAMFSEMLRVSRHRVAIFERIEKTLKGDELCVGRPVKYYEEIANKNGFSLIKSSFINIQVSYLVCGVIRKLFSKNRKEGEPLSNFAKNLQSMALFSTQFLDKVFISKRDLGMLVFERMK